MLNPDTRALPEVLAFIDDLRANCMGPLPDEEDGLFCSKWCKETASCVRHLRQAHRDGRIQDPDVQDASRIRLAFLAIGGYGALGRYLSTQTRGAVRERANGLCQKCGQPGVDVDHIAGSSPELDNLQLLCKACHKEKTAENLVPAPLEIRERIAQLMFDRLAPGRPRLLADDDTTWADIWRGLKRARRQRLLDLLEENGIDPRGLKSRAEMIAALDDEHEEDDEWEGVDDEGSSASIRRPRGTTTAAMAPTATAPARCTATTELKLSRRHLLPGTRRGLPQTCGTPVRSPVSLGVQARRR